MKRNLLLSTMLIMFSFSVAQDTGGDMTGGDMTGGEMTGGDMMMTDDATFDSLIPGSTAGGDMTGGDMSGMDTSSMTIAEVVAANPNFGILAQLVRSAGLLETLEGEGPFTVFAPSDDAFLPFTNTDVVSLLGDPDALANVLTYHVVEGELSAEDLMSMSSVTTLQGGELTVSEAVGETGGDVTGGVGDLGMTGGDMTGGMTDMEPSLMVGDATVIIAGIETANGVIHVIDTVLVPGN